MTAYVQKVSTVPPTHYTGTPIDMVLPGGVGGGNTLLLVATGSNTQTITSVTGCGATWSKLQSQLWNGQNSELWVGTGATSGTTVSISWTGTNTWVDCILSEFSGADVLDSQQTAGSSVDASTAVVTATAVGQVAYGAIAKFFFDSPISSWTDTPAAWTDIDNVTTDATSQTNYTASYRVTTATGDHHRVGHTTNNGPWMGFGVLLGAVPPPPRKKNICVVSGIAVARASAW